MDLLQLVTRKKTEVEGRTRQNLLKEKDEVLNLEAFVKPVNRMMLDDARRESRDVIKEDIECFVVGDPKNLDGSATDSTGHINGFIKRLKQQYPSIPVYQIDERFTSKIAKQSILASGVKKKGRQNKALVDEISATIILQSFLDYRS